MNETLFAQLCDMCLSLLVSRKGHVHSVGVFVSEDTRRLFSFHGSGFHGTCRWAFESSAPLSNLAEVK